MCSSIVSLKFPKFKKYGILTSESLNLLNINFLNYVEINYKNSSDGIISGFNITCENKRVNIEKGILKIDNKIIWSNEDANICLPDEEGRYYCILELEDNTNEYFDILNLKYSFITQQEYENQFILFSIILREGANVSYENKSFYQFRDEYNTIDLIKQKYSVINSKYASISPNITKNFAKELSKKENLMVEDINFMFCCINSVVSKELIVSYINFKLKENLDFNVDNEKIVRYIYKVLNMKNNVKSKEEKDINEKISIL